MAKLCYVNSITGNNANSGLSAVLAKKTIAGARSATALATASTLASPDTVLIAPGVYPEPNTLWNAGTDQNVVYMADGTGEVIVDFEQKGGTDSTGAGFNDNWRIVPTVNVIFIGIKFRNVYTGSFPSTPMMTTAGTFLHCVFYQRPSDVPIANTGTAVNTFTGARVENCSFHNLASGMSGGNSATIAYNNYFVSVTTPFSLTMTRDYNAFPGNTETNGINTSTGANPGFRDTANEDFRLDPTILADYQAFLQGGRFGSRIGAFGKPGIYYSSTYAQLRMITKSPAGSHARLVAWGNDSSFTPAVPGSTIIQDPTTNELVIDLATTPTATDARARSGVIDLGAVTPRGLTNVCIGKFEDLPAGAALDTNTTLPKKYEYRASDTSFAIGDADLLPGTSIAWTEFEQKDYLNLSSTYRYIQLRVTFVTNHTNA